MTRVRLIRSTGAVSTTVTPGLKIPGPRGTQTTVSENHTEFWDPKARRPRVPGMDVGGRFFTQRFYTWAPTAIPVDYRFSYVDSAVTDQYHYHGPIYAYPPQIAADGLLSFASSESSLKSKGTEAIAKCKPTNPVADVATFLGELKSDGLPKLLGSSLWKKKTLEARDAGDELLNSEFGWKPLVGDITDIIDGVKHARDLIDQKERDAGKIVRRRYEFPVEESIKDEILSSQTAVLEATGGAIGIFDPLLESRVHKETYTYRKIWFSGAFTYHMPTENWYSRSAIGKLGEQIDTVFGTQLSPEVLWNLAPWSWAVDWFANVGDVADNLSDWASDGLVLNWGYIMEHSVKRVRFYNPGRGGLRNPYLGISDVIAEVETKQRYPATPFGFGVSWNGLSPRQLSIATALGITRRS